MIQASVTSFLDRQLGPTADTLDAQVQAAVAAALDKRLGPAVGSLGSRTTSFVEQRLREPVNTLNHYVNTSVAAALEQRLGPNGGALTAQITFITTPTSISPSVPLAKAQVLGEITATKGNNGVCPAEELADARPTGKGGSNEKEQPTEKLNAIESESPKTESPDSADELSVRTATSKNSNEPTSKETGTTHSGASKSAVYPLFADSTSKSKTGPSAVLTSKPNRMIQGPSNSADKTRPKRRANERDEADSFDNTGGAGSSLSEEEKEESEIEEPKRKRPKVKLDPPGYTNGPSIRFRRVSPQLTACAKSRGFPRVIDLKSFTEASNKQNLTMADVVATVLFNYDPLSLYAFMDMDSYPTFSFIRKEYDRRARDFVIERRRESYGVVVKVSGIQLIGG